MCALLASPPLAAPALADERPDLTALPIEQLLNLEVSTASKIPQKISEAPSSVSVITADDIRRHGYRTLADILQGVRAITVTYDRNYHYIGTRGLGFPGDLNTRVLILVDGRRLNDVVYDQGAIGTEFPVDVGLIDRVEFVPGPGSAIYGSSAFFGVVNVITKTGAQLAGAELAAGATRYQGREASAAFGTRTGRGVELLLGASWAGTDGRDLYFPEFDDAGSQGGVARGLDHDRYRRALAKLAWAGIQAQAYAARRAKGVPTAAFGQQFNDPRSHTVDDYASASLSWQGSPAPGLELYASADLARYRYFGSYAYTFEPTPTNIDVSRASSSGAELRLLSSRWQGHRVIAGLEYRRDTRRSMRNFDIDPFASSLDVDQPRHRFAVYLQDEMRLGERIILNTGLRHDRDADGASSTNPRVALLYKATPRTTLKALYGTAFRSPNAYERYYATDNDYKLNPGLRPERIRTWELGAEYFPTERFRASASLFQYRVKDLLALNTDPADGLLYFANLDSAHSRGVELEVEWIRESGATLKASASLQSAHNGASHEWLSNSPRRLFKLRYAAPSLGERLRTGFEYQFTGRRRTPLGGAVGSFGVVNLTLLGQPLGKRMELSASVYNLLGKRYADPPSEEHFDNRTPPRHLQALARDGRTWRLLASFRF